MYLLIKCILIPLAIISADANGPTAGKYPEAVEAFRCNFDVSSDVNYDGWPDGWTRRHGQGYPNYIKIEILPATTPKGEQCLQIELDGGGAAVFAPPVEVNTLYSYMLEGTFKTEGLINDRAYFSLIYLDSEKHPISTFNSEEIADTRGWKTIQIGPIAPPSLDTKLAVLGMNVEPRGAEDLKGTVKFAEVRLIRLPRLELQTNQDYNLFLDPAKVKVTCKASGFIKKSPAVTFNLLDVHGKNLGQETLKWQKDKEDRNAEDDSDSEESSESSAQKVYTAAWEPTIPGPGFYYVRAELNEQGQSFQSCECSLAIITAHKRPTGGDFGWCLPQGPHPIPLAELNPLLKQAGVNWVKYPLWFAGNDGGANLEHLLNFSESLHEENIELVGLLIDPPEAVRGQIGQARSITAAGIFGAPTKVWYPSVEPAISQLAGQVRWWQLGVDDDTSFLNLPDYFDKLTEVKKELEKAAQIVNLGIGWDCSNNLPSEKTEGNLPLRFVALTSKQQLSAKELEAYLDANKNVPQKRWVTLKPMSKLNNTLDARADDLLRRIIAAKIHGADAIFCPNPFDENSGLMNKDGTPGELFLPWRTAALELSGSSLIGEIPLPRGSKNMVFSRSSDAMMIVWSNKAVEEVLYLGENMKQIDLWGRTVTQEMRNKLQVIRVDSLPTFVTGLNESIVLWYKELGFEKGRLASVFDKPQTDTIVIKNPFPRDITGTATIVPPNGWIVSPKQIDLRLAADETLRQPILFSLPDTTGGGRHRVRVDFDIQTDKPHQFSVYKHIDIGLGDVYIEISSQLNAQNELEVEQRFVNDSKNTVNFRCELFAPDRRRVTTQVIALGTGQKTHVYHLDDGKQLIGKTLWLRASEVNGPRILNYRFTATNEGAAVKDEG